MEENIQQEENQLFPEDPESPKVEEKKSFFKEFYSKYRKQIDYIVFALISLATLITVSLSVYIIVIKYFLNIGE